MLGVFFLSFPTAAAVAVAPGFFSVGAMICVGEREREREGGGWVDEEMKDEFTLQ